MRRSYRGGQRMAFGAQIAKEEKAKKMGLHTL
jgi:hypothetical protein